MYQYNIQIHSAYIELLPFTIRDTVPQEKQLRGNSKSDALGCLIGNRMVIGIFAFWVGAMLVGECTLWRGIIYPEKRRKCLFQAAGTAYHPPPTPDPPMYTYPLQQNWLSHEEDLRSRWSIMDVEKIWAVGDQFPRRIIQRIPNSYNTSWESKRPTNNSKSPQDIHFQPIKAGLSWIIHLTTWGDDPIWSQYIGMHHRIKYIWIHLGLPKVSYQAVDYLDVPLEVRITGQDQWRIRYL